jgi:L-seryl-tRNA(Ser) seleniumtransferase
MADYRVIPSIEQLRQREAVRALERDYGRDAIVRALREEADAIRARLSAGAQDSAGSAPPAPDAAAIATAIEEGVRARLSRFTAASLRPVINATGIIIHTNLGRAPLAEPAARTLAALAAGYSNLEYDLAEGRRGRRDVHAEALLCRLTGAEAAAVVNNNAAATLVLLAALAGGREVIVSRGELVEIGGGFRVPEIMAQSGAILREVGTTNRTRVGDYADAVGDRTALILRVHRSNFRIEGFTEQPSLADLVALGRERGIPVIEDLGSGYVGLPGESSGAAMDRAVGGEPKVQASLEAGVDAVCFSGDKLLGGPQAGIILGRASLVRAVRFHPLMRAVRVGKLTYAALEATLAEYLAGRAGRTVPVMRAIAFSAADIERRARAVLERVRDARRFEAEIVDGASAIGGGTTPGLEIPTRLIALSAPGKTVDQLERALRALEPPVIARIENDRLLLDLRTVLPDQDGLLAEGLSRLTPDESLEDR